MGLGRLAVLTQPDSLTRQEFYRDSGKKGILQREKLVHLERVELPTA
jgi:hypothetical protein